MQIDKSLLSKLEKLSSLKIQDEKSNETLKQLSEILNFVENLNELDLSSQEASFTTVQGGTPFREDVPLQNPEIISTILANAPKKVDGFFVVPKIIE